MYDERLERKGMPLEKCGTGKTRLKRLVSIVTGKVNKTYDFVFPVLVALVFYSWVLYGARFWTGVFSAQLLMLMVLAGPTDKFVDKVAGVWFARKRFRQNITDLDAACSWIIGIADFHGSDISFCVKRKNRPNYKISITRADEV